MTYSNALRVLSLLLFAPWLSFSSHAQQTGDGSVYSRFGLGELRQFPSSQLQAMGGGGTGFPSFGAVNLSNPASWGARVLTRVSGGLLYENLTMTDASDARSRLVSSALNGIHVGFPLKSQKLGLGLAYVPYTRVNYRVQEEGTLSPPDDDEVPFTIQHTGGGGLQQVTGGLGWQINPNVAVGLQANWIFGILEQRRETRFASGFYQTATVASATRLHGVNGTAGVLVRLPNLLRPADQLAFGATFTLPTTLTGKRVPTLALGQAEPDTLAGDRSGDVSLPYGVALGVSYQTDSRWTFLLDGRYEPWSQFESTFDFPGYDPDAGLTLRDRWRFSGGIEYFPAGRDFNASFLRRTAYRLGFYYDASYASPLPDVTIRTLAVTGGLSLPTMHPGTRIDLNLEVGTRGTTDRGLIRDRFVRVGLNVNFGERWFVKRKLG
ncbi:MAG: hypothetical protein D6746_04890 [Bacteroidetes bacterium]|nr:MAG: hypothetical protein D6746_04890 [Bacteroidota bacterium]